MCLKNCFMLSLILIRLFFSLAFSIYASTSALRSRHATSLYLTIPGERKGSGKVQININNSVREYDALTDSEDDLKTGTSITVTEVLDASTLLVEEINSLII